MSSGRFYPCLVCLLRASVYTLRGSSHYDGVSLIQFSCIILQWMLEMIESALNLVSHPAVFSAKLWAPSIVMLHLHTHTTSMNHARGEGGRWVSERESEKERQKKRGCIYDVYSLQFKRLKRPTVKSHLSNGGALICLIVSNIVQTIKAKLGRICNSNQLPQQVWAAEEQPALSFGISFSWVENNDTKSLPWIPWPIPKGENGGY